MRLVADKAEFVGIISTLTLETYNLLTVMDGVCRGFEITVILCVVANIKNVFILIDQPHCVNPSVFTLEMDLLDELVLTNFNRFHFEVTSCPMLSNSKHRRLMSIREYKL